MSGAAKTLEQHLSGGITTVCRAWLIERADGVRLGFTDHDQELAFEGVEFRPNTGFNTTDLHQATGLSVDNAETTGVLRDDAIAEADIVAGRYDGADVRVWLVNWRDPAQRQLVFRGSIGELRRSGGVFRAELQGLSAPLGQVRGRVYQPACSAELGDARCGFDLDQGGYRCEGAVVDVHAGTEITVAIEGTYEPQWFLRGRLDVMDGAACGLGGMIRADDSQGDLRRIALWEPLGAPLAPGDRVRLTAGCDKRDRTCREKFNNILNFRGFPSLPTEDWLVAPPARAGRGGLGGKR